MYQPLRTLIKTTLVALAAAAIFLSAPTLRAQVTNDTGTSGAFSDVAIWTNAPVDGVYETNFVRIFGTGALLFTNDLLNPFVLHQLAIQNSAATLIMGGTSLVFTNEGATLPRLENNGAGAATISTGIRLRSGLIIGGTGGGNIVISTNGIIDDIGVNAITKEGTNRLILTTANTFGGGLVLNNGFVELQNRQAAGTGATITLNGGNLVLRSNVTSIFGPSAGVGYNVTLNSNATISVQSLVGVNNTLSIGTLNVGANVLTVNNTSNYILGVINPAVHNGGTFNLASAIAYSNSVTFLNTNNFNGAGSNIFRIAQNITNATFYGGPQIFGGVTNPGGGTMTFFGAVFHSGTNTFALSNTTTFATSVTLDTNAGIRFTNSGAINFNGAAMTLNGSNTFIGSPFIATTNNTGVGGFFVTNNAATVTINGVVGEATAGSVLARSGTGTLGQMGAVVLTNNNTYTGGAVINAGTLQFNAGNTNIGAAAAANFTNQAGPTGIVRTTGSEAQLNLRGNTNTDFNVNLDIVAGNATLNVDRLAVVTGNTLSISSLTFRGNTTLTNNTANNFLTVVRGPVTMVNAATINANAGNIRLDSDFIATNRTLTKSGGGTMFLQLNSYTNGINFAVTGGQLQWNYNVTGPGVISTGMNANTLVLNGGGFRPAPTNSVSPGQDFFFTNAITAQGTASSLTGSQLTNASGNYPRITFTGPVLLQGNLGVGSSDASQTTSIAPNVSYNGTFTIDQTGIGLPADPLSSIALQGTVRALTGVKAVNTETFYDSDVNGNLVDSINGLFNNPLMLSGGTSSLSRMNIRGTANTYAGGTVVQGAANGGIVNIDAGSQLGTGDITISPLGRLRLQSVANVAAGKTVLVYAGGVLGIGTNIDLTSIIHPASSGVLAIDNASTTSFGPGDDYTQSLNMSTIGNGRMYLGSSLSNGVYASASLGAGAGNVYRLGGPAALMFSNTANILTGNNVVQVGAPNHQIGNGNLMLNAAANAVLIDRRESTNTTGTIILGQANNYTGNTVLNAGTLIANAAGALGTNSVVFNGGTLILGASGAYPATGAGIPVVPVGGSLINLTDGTTSPFGASGSNSTMHVYGTLASAGPAGTFIGLTNFTTHPGGIISLDNNSGNNLDRWDNGASLLLNGATLQWTNAPLAASTYSETIGTLTAMGGSVLRTTGVTNAGSASTFTVADIARSGNGTLRLATFGAGALANYDLIGGSNRIVNSANPATVNGMVAPWVINGTSNTFVGYDAVIGYTNVVYSTNTLNSNAVDANTVVNQNANLLMTNNRAVYALRLQSAVASLSNTVSIQSGGLIFGASVGIQPALIFTNSGGSPIEALINVGAGLTGTVSNSISAAGITKFGTGALLLVGNSNAAYASGWNINEGTLQVTGINALGTSVGGNFINLNGGATLNLNAGVSNSTYTGGAITLLDFGNTVRINTGIGTVTNTIPSITINSSVAGQGATATLATANSANQVNVPVLTLNDNTVLSMSNGISASGGVANFSIGALNATNITLTKIGGGQLFLAGDNSIGTFSNSTLNISQGALGFGHVNAFGGAGSVVNIGNDAVLDIRSGINNFGSVAPVATVNQLAGSSERWSHSLARFSDAATLETRNLASGVGLQLNTDLVGLTNKTIGLNGGVFEPFVYSDATGPVNRSNGLGVTLNVISDSFIGRGTADPGVAAVTLVLEGPLTGAGKLTKIGANTVTLRSRDSNPASGYTAGFDIKAGILQAETLTNASGLTVISNNLLGTGLITLGGGTLNIRGDTNLFLANNILVTNVSALSIDRVTTNSESRTVTFGGLTNLGSLLNITQANTNSLFFTGGVRLVNSILSSAGALQPVQFNSTLDLFGDNTITGGGSNLVVQGLTTFGTNGILRYSVTGGGIFNGNVVLNGTNRINSSTALRFNTNIVNGASGASGLIKTLAGNVTIIGSNTYSGGTVFERVGTMTLLVSNTVSPFGTGPVSLEGTAGAFGTAGPTMQLRQAANLTVGNAGNIFTIKSNVIFNVDRTGGAAFPTFTMPGKLRFAPGNPNFLSFTNTTLTVSGANNAIINLLGGVELNGASIINQTQDPAANNDFGLRIGGPITEGTAGSSLVKMGIRALGYTNHAAPTHTGGTMIYQGGVYWRPVTNLAGGTYSFGTGPITLDSAGAFGFGALSNNFTIANNFVLPGTRYGGSGINNYGVGTIDATPASAQPVQTTFTGSISLGQTLLLTANNFTGPALAPAGQGGNFTINTHPGTFTGTLTLACGDGTLLVVGSGGGVDRFLYSGNVVGSGMLDVLANNSGNIEFRGNNSGLGGMHIKRSYVGNTGYVKFFDTAAIPATKVMVDSGAQIAVPLTHFVGAGGIEGLTNYFNLNHGSIVALDGSNVAATTLANAMNLNTLGKDIRLGVSEGYTTVINSAITPFGSVLRLGAGQGELRIGETNALGVNLLTGANSLSAGPIPWGDSTETVSIDRVQAGTLSLYGANDYSGGTVINPGTTVNLGQSNALGSGAVRIYGTLQNPNVNAEASIAQAAITGTDGFTNLNAVILQPGGQLILDSRPAIHTSSNRFGDTVPLALNGGQLTIFGNNSVSTNSEFISDIIYGGASRISLQSQNAGNLTLLQAGSLARVGSGVLELQYANQTFGGPRNRLTVLGAPATNVVNGMVAPYIVNGTDRTFLTYVPSFGFTNATFTTTNIAASTSTSIVDVPLNTNLVAGVGVYSLRLGNGLSISNLAVTITNFGGGVIYNSGANNGVIQPRMDFNGGEGVIYVAVARTLSMTATSAVFNASSITKSGLGALSLTQSNLVYGSGWNVQQGTLVATSNALGLASVGNFVNLNGNGSVLQLDGHGGTATFTSGKITSLDNNIIVNNFGGDDRVELFGGLGLDLNTVNSGPLASHLRFDLPNNRTVARVTGAVSLLSDAVLNVRNTGSAGSSTGGSNRLDIAGGLVGTGRTLTKMGNGVLQISSDNIGTFTGSTLNVTAGTLALAHNGAAGPASSTVNIGANTVLELPVAITNFVPTATINQAVGSAERWQSTFNRFNDNATPETYINKPGVDLQLAFSTITNQIANASAKTVQMNGGTFGGYMYNDVGANVISNHLNFQLAGSSGIGQSMIDLGRSGASAGTEGGMVTYYNGTISETGGSQTLTKMGLDTAVLTGANTYTGGTMIKAGYLVASNATGSATGTGPVVVTNAGRLMGGSSNAAAGFIGGLVTVERGGLIGAGPVTGAAAANGQAVLTLNGGLTINSNGVLSMDIFGTGATSRQYDTINVNGAVTLGVGSLFDAIVNIGFTPAVGNMFTVVNNDGADAVTGFFFGMPEGSSFSPNGRSDISFSISYLAGTGNDIVLTVVPEPGQVALMVIGGALVGWHVVRRRRNA